MRHLVAIISLLFLFAPSVAGVEKTFYVLNQEQGLLGQHVLQMLQLEDGRMVVDTERGVCLWDGKAFQSVLRDSTDYAPLPGYEEFTRLFVDCDQRLWVKDTRQVACLDLRTLQWLPNADRLIGCPDDFYVDGQSDIWTVRDSTVRRMSDGLQLTLTLNSGRVQEVQTDSAMAYVFTSDGAVSLFGLRDGVLQASYPAYDEAEAKTLDKFSLVVRDNDGVFYQLRMGWGHAVLLSFHPDTSQWLKHLDADYALHTLIVSPEQKIYVSCAKGYWVIDPQTEEQHLLTRLRLPDGSVLASGYNTICQDRDGGIWLGSYDHGVLYASTEADLFRTSRYGWAWAILLLTAAAILLFSVWHAVHRRKSQPKRLEVSPPETTSLNVRDSESQSKINSETNVFLQRVRGLVEQNMANSDYSVEQLASDLCMERSGLYKKVAALSGQSPTLFIRSIRLEHAALMLKEGHHTVTEISELTGFSSPQYFNKCFQQQYGCRPSEFVKR